MFNELSESTEKVDEQRGKRNGDGSRVIQVCYKTNTRSLFFRWTIAGENVVDYWWWTQMLTIVGM